VRVAFAFVVLAFVGGCASSSSGNHDAAGTEDASSSADAGVDLDAAPDASTVAPPRPGRDIVSTGGRIRGGTVTMDVEIGLPVDQSEATNGTRRLRGAAVVNP
jgi:hypothetical protein